MSYDILNVLGGHMKGEENLEEKLLIAKLADKIKESKIKNIFVKIGGYTLELYVIHYHFANMLNFYDKQYDFYTLEGFLFVVVSFVAMCAVTFCCIWMMKKVRVIDFLFFGKKDRR